jgi:hypothetical protein
MVVARLLMMSSCVSRNRSASAGDEPASLRSSVPSTFWASALISTVAWARKRGVMNSVASTAKPMAAAKMASTAKRDR